MNHTANRMTSHRMNNAIDKVTSAIITIGCARMLQSLLGTWCNELCQSTQQKTGKLTGQKLENMSWNLWQGSQDQNTNAAILHT